MKKNPKNLWRNLKEALDSDSKCGAREEGYIILHCIAHGPSGKELDTHQRARKQQITHSWARLKTSQNIFLNYCLWPFLDYYNSLEHTRRGMSCNSFDIKTWCHEPLIYVNQGQKRLIFGGNAEERNFWDPEYPLNNPSALFISLNHLSAKRGNVFMAVVWAHFNLMHFFFFIEESFVCLWTQRGQKMSTHL